MTRSRAILAATVAAAALLVASCGNDTPTTPSPDPTTAESSPGATPSASPSAVVVKPDRPAEMDDDGPAGAEAAATYFLQLDDYIMKTGDTKDWEAMSHKSCEHCAARLDQAQGIAKKDAVWDGGETKARVLHTYAQDAATGIWPIDFRITVAPVTVKDSSGAKVFEDPATSGDFRVEVARRDGEWIVIGVANKPES